MRRCVPLCCLALALPTTAQELRHVDTPFFQNATWDPVRQRVVATSIGGYSFDWDGVAWRHAADAGAPAGFTWFDLATQRRMTFERRFVTGIGMPLTLWARAGSGWQVQPMPSQPPVRNDMALAYDAARGEVVGFGGYSVSPLGPLGDTWTWNGTAWTQRLVAGPSPRTQATIGYDATRQRVVLFGGRTQQGALSTLIDTWEWDGSTWILVPTTGAPPPHTPSRLVHDPARQRLVMVGRADGGSFPNQLWEYDGAMWTQGPAPPPAVGIEGPVVHDPVRGETLVFGGFGTFEKLGGVAAWNGIAWSARPGFTDLPGQGYGTEITMAPNGVDVCLFAPYIGIAASSDLWTFDGAAWSLTASGGPPPRGDAAVWTLGGTVYVHAGFGGTHLNDLWAWDGVTWTQRFPAVSPPPRFRATWAVDTTAQRAVVFGGFDVGGTRNDTWLFDGTQWQQAVIGTAPPARMQAAMAHDPLRNRTVLFGGGGGPSGVLILNDTWEWNGTQWQLIANAGAPPRGGRMTWDPTSQRVLYFARGTSGSYEVHTWNGVAWTSVAGLGTLGSANPLHAELPRAGTTLAGRVFVADQWCGVHEWIPTPARAADYGSACGAGAPRLVAASLPRVGDLAFGFDVTGVPGGGPVALAGAMSSASLPFFGCTLLVAPDEACSLTTASGTGFAFVPLAVPPAPALAGLSLYFQAACLSATTSNGFALSSGLRIDLGR